MNPRRYPTGPRYRTNRPSRSLSPAHGGRRPIVVGSIATTSVVLVGIVAAVVLWPSSEVSVEQRESRAAAFDATRPKDVLAVRPTATARAEPTPNPTATPKPLPTLDPALTAEEVDSTIRFAQMMLEFETKQRQINRDYRFYDIEILTRWVGDSLIGAEVLLERQRELLGEVRLVEPSIEQATVVLALYEDSAQEEVDAFANLVAALDPLNDAGISMVVGIRSGMITQMGAFDGLSRAGMFRIRAREQLELLLNRVGTSLESL